MRQLPMMKKHRKKVLIVEDDENLAEVISKRLMRLNLEVDQIHRGIDAKDRLEKKSYDLVLIDIGLPDMNGYKVLKSIRELGVKTPFIVITSHVDKQDQISSYKSGANLFHAKPIDFNLLETQVRGLLVLHTPKDDIVIGDLSLDSEFRLLIIDGDEYDLSYKEFELVKLLLANPGQIFSREQVIRQTFKGVYEPQPSSVDTLISRFRKKLGRHSEELIETVHGAGFRLGQKYVELERGL